MNKSFKIVIKFKKLSQNIQKILDQTSHGGNRFGRFLIAVCIIHELAHITLCFLNYTKQLELGVQTFSAKSSNSSELFCVAVCRIISYDNLLVIWLWPRQKCMFFLYYLVLFKYIKIHQQEISSISRNDFIFVCVFPSYKLFVWSS